MQMEMKMALKPCRECKTEISHEAKTCPHCGVTRPTGRTEQQRLGVFLFSIVSFFVIGGMMVGGSKDGPASACVSDWTKCKDNSDLANNWKDYRLDVSSACKLEANEMAKYGDPKWSWYSFGSFLPGDSAATKGVITAIDSDVQFQNGFGAWARTRVVCQYDLRNKKVLNVSFNDR